MSIKLLRTFTLGQRRFNAGDLIDLELEGKHKKDLVDQGYASWYTPIPIPIPVIEKEVVNPAIEKEVVNPAIEKEVVKPAIEKTVVLKKDKS